MCALHVHRLASNEEWKSRCLRPKHLLSKLPSHSKKVHWNDRVTIIRFMTPDESQNCEGEEYMCQPKKIMSSVVDVIRDGLSQDTMLGDSQQSSDAEVNEVEHILYK